MAFPDLSYPIVANIDYSPTMESFPYPDTFGKAYLADSYTAQPDYSLDSFFDSPVNSIEQPSPNSVSSPNRAVFNNTVPAAANSYSAPYNPVPYGRVDHFGSNGISFDPTTIDSFGNNDASSISASRTPSLCGDASQTLQPGSPSMSPRSLKRESPADDEELTLETRQPPRKRGRPRLDRISICETITSATSANSKARQSHRLPHNQVERKYREGLNSELERLRRAVPTLPQCDHDSVVGQPKPSKAMVLAGAIDYIKKLERERDAAIEECERWKDSQMPNYGVWRRRGPAEDVGL